MNVLVCVIVLVVLALVALLYRKEIDQRDDWNQLLCDSGQRLSV
jgi:hypothetical protein